MKDGRPSTRVIRLTSTRKFVFVSPYSRSFVFCLRQWTKKPAGGANDCFVDRISKHVIT